MLIYIILMLALAYFFQKEGQKLSLIHISEPTRH